MEFDDYDYSNVDMDAVMKTVMPKLTQKFAQKLMIITTPSGNKEGYFYKLWEKSQ